MYYWIRPKWPSVWHYCIHSSHWERKDRHHALCVSRKWFNLPVSLLTLDSCLSILWISFSNHFCDACKVHMPHKCFESSQVVCAKMHINPLDLVVEIFRCIAKASQMNWWWQWFCPMIVRKLITFHLVNVWSTLLVNRDGDRCLWPWATFRAQPVFQPVNRLFCPN